MNYSTTSGSIEVVCGPMFAGKTEELIRRIKRLNYAKKTYLVFKSQIDDRYTDKCVLMSHSQQSIDSLVINHSYEILNHINDKVDAVIIDEAQFLDKGLVEVVNQLANQGLRVIIGGLDLDFRGEPFGPMPYLLAIAEHVTKLSAICPVTGFNATRTQRLVDGKPACKMQPTIVVGAAETYEPRSRCSHQVVLLDATPEPSV